MDTIVLYKTINARKIKKKEEKRKREESRQENRRPECLKDNVGHKRGLMGLHGFGRVNSSSGVRANMGTLIPNIKSWGNGPVV